MDVPSRIENLEFKYASYEISELAELFYTYKDAQNQCAPHQSEAVKRLKNKEVLSLGDLKTIELYDINHSNLVALANSIIKKCRDWVPVAESFNLKFESGAQVIIRPYVEGDELPVEVINKKDELLNKSKTPTS